MVLLILALTLGSVVGWILFAYLLLKLWLQDENTYDQEIHRQ